MDRAGLVGNDGPTHMGLYDIAYLLAVPNMTVTAPKDGAEMLALTRLGVQHTDGPFSLRYPRDNVPTAVPALSEIPNVEYGTWEVLRSGHGLAILAVGTMVLPALNVASALAAENIDASVVNCRFLKPMDEKTLAWVLEHHEAIITIEEGTVVNGFGPALAARVDVPVEIMGVPDRIIQHANRDQQLAEVGLDAAGITARVRDVAKRIQFAQVRETA
jgi:1-deoxy-D-xylulose-5-phosphate synthase